MITKLCAWWLEKRGYHLVAPGSCEMVISGNFYATQHNDGSYKVIPPFPNAYISVLCGSVATLNAESRGIGDVEVRKTSTGGETWWAL